MTKSRLKILVVSSKYPPEYAGSGWRAHQTYLRLREKFPVDFDVLTGSVEANRSQEYDIDDVKVYRIANKLMPQPSHQAWDRRGWQDRIALRINYFSEAWPVWRFLKERGGRYDVFHVFGQAAVTSAAILAANRKKKPLLVEVTYDAPVRPYVPFLWRGLGFSAPFHPQAQMVCISPRLEVRCRREGIVNEIWTRPNPVDIRRFRPRPEERFELRRRYAIPGEGTIVILHLAKFMPLKNQSFLIDMMKHLPENFYLVCAGPLVNVGPNASRDQGYFQTLQKKIQEAGLSERVSLRPGFVERPEDWMALSDLTVLPSRQEALGTPVLESLCCGIPVVAHRIEGVTDAWIEEGTNGFLSGLEENEFAGKIQRALSLDRTKFAESIEGLRSRVNTETIDAEYFARLCRLAGRHQMESSFEISS